jgi:hypothetical protein
VPHSKLIVLAFCGTWKAAYAIGPAKMSELIFPAGDDFMRIALMPHIPEQSIFFEIEYIVQGQRQLHHAQVAGEVPSGFADRIENELSYFIRQRLQLRDWQLLQIRRAVYLV